MSGRAWVRIVGAVAALWNAVGVYSYLAHVGVVGGPATAAAMSPVITAAFAIGVFAGVLGGLALLLRSPWARSLLWLSWAGTVIDWVWVFGWSDAASVPLGVTVLVLATLFALVAEWHARSRPVQRSSH